MPRLIIWLLILAALAVLIVQNLSTPVSLVILGSARTPQIPFGLLLLGAVCIGALITLILYGLVGLRRSPESKYRPMGRRVPYPDSPGSTTLPDSGPPSGSTYGSTSTAASPYNAASSSTAFVSEPAPPQDYPQDSASGAPSSSYQYSSSYREDPVSSPEPPFTVGQPPFREGQIEDRTEKKKSRFSAQEEGSVEGSRIGDDWGELNTARKRNSWDTENEGDRDSGIAGAKQGFFDLIGMGGSPDRSSGRSGGVGAGDRDIDDLDSGWESYEGYDNSAPPPAATGKRVYSDGLYSEDLGPNGRYEDEGYEDEGYEGYEDEGYEDDSVYEADYRVIVPPSQPLDDGEEEYRS